MYEIPVTDAQEIAKHFNSKVSGNKLLITKNLGHRKILGDTVIINQILDFLV